MINHQYMDGKARRPSLVIWAQREIADPINDIAISYSSKEEVIFILYSFTNFNYIGNIDLNESQLCFNEKCYYFSKKC